VSDSDPRQQSGASLVRVSVGLEDLEDLQADFAAVLEHAGRSVPALGAV
jgi:cystathionine beta-lyase/cystathionine gamma-synthase